jgi:two-component system response regulator NreC
MSEQSVTVIRLALVDEQTLFREGLRALMDRESDFTVVGQAASVQALDALDIEPNVVITDLPAPDVGFDIVIEQLRTRFDGVAIVALTALEDLQTIRNVLAAGADGYILKSAGVTDLFAGIRAVARGGLYLQSSIGIAFASKPSEDLVPPTIGGLTPKETDVLRLLSLGHTNAEIARLVGASLRTIETHRAHIHQKLDRHTRAELVRYSLDAGLLRLDERGEHAPVAAAVVGREPDSLDG